MLAIRSIHRRVRMYTEAMETLKSFLLSHMFEYNAWYVDGTMSHSQGMFLIKRLRCFEFPRRFSCSLVVMLSRQRRKALLEVQLGDQELATARNA
jgi:hypothetical protein